MRRRVRSSVKRLPLDDLRANEAEAAISALPVERVYFYSGNGRQVAIFEGSESYVFFRLSHNERQRMKDGRVIHNHPPRNQFPRGDPRYDALSFSAGDWYVAADLDVAESIVLTPTWRYVLSRPIVGWLAFDQTPTEIEQMFTSLSHHVTREDAENVRTGITATEAAEATRSHRINERYANEIGANYRRELR